VEDQAIFTVGSCKSEEDFSTLSLGMCGLAHIVFKILQAKYPVFKEAIPPIELGTYVDKSTNDAIAKRVASWFTSGRDSVEKWRASLR
jgi:threonyl-tRNA synthetase